MVDWCTLYGTLLSIKMAAEAAILFMHGGT